MLNSYKIEKDSVAFSSLSFLVFLMMIISHFMIFLNFFFDESNFGSKLIELIQMNFEQKT